MVLFISILVTAVMVTPFTVYLCAKLGTYGALVGRRRFYQKYPESPK